MQGHEFHTSAPSWNDIPINSSPINSSQDPSKGFTAIEHISGNISEIHLKESDGGADKIMRKQPSELERLQEEFRRLAARSMVGIGAYESEQIETTLNPVGKQIRGDCQGKLGKQVRTSLNRSSQTGNSQTKVDDRVDFLAPFPRHPIPSDESKSEVRGVLEKRKKRSGKSSESMGTNQSHLRTLKPKLALKEIKERELEFRTREKTKERTRSAMEKLFKDIALLQVFTLFVDSLRSTL